MSYEEYRQIMVDEIIDRYYPQLKGIAIYNLTPVLCKNKDSYYWTVINFTDAQVRTTTFQDIHMGKWTSKESS